VKEQDWITIQISIRTTYEDQRLKSICDLVTSTFKDLDLVRVERTTISEYQSRTISVKFLLQSK
jgi:hypothetical protein